MKLQALATSLALLALPLSSAPLSALPLSARQVLTVGPSGSGAQFSVIQDAIDAAAPGDVVLIEPGTYEPFVVEKALHIQGAGPFDTLISTDSGGPVSLPTIATIQNIPADGVCVVAGIGSLLGGLLLNSQGMVDINASEGTVILHDLRLETLAGDASVDADEVDRLLISDSLLDGGGGNGIGKGPTLMVEDTRLWALESRIEAPDLFTPFIGAPNLTVLLEDAEARFSGCTLLGPSADLGLVFEGGDALHAAGSELAIERSVLFGGAGITGGGGYAMRLFEGSTATAHADSLVAAGTGGAGVAVTVDATSQSITDGSVSPTLSLPKPSAGAGDTVVLDLYGTAGAAAVLFASATPSAGATVPGVLGDIFVDLTAPIVLGTFVLDGVGEEATSFSAPQVMTPSLAAFQWVEVGTALTASNPAFLSLR